MIISVIFYMNQIVHPKISYQYAFLPYFLSINWMYRFARVYLVYFNRPVKLFKMPYPAKIINNVTYCPIVTVKLYPIRQLYHRL